MRRDLDRLMRERSLAGMVVFAHDRYSQAMHYVTGQKLHYGVYFRAPGPEGGEPRAHLVHDPMERDQAAAVGCDISGFPQHGLARLQTEEGGNPAKVFGRLIGEVCATLGIEGRIALHGDLPGGFAWNLVERMRAVNPALSVDSGHPDILLQARSTKDPDEIEAIRRAARGTVEAMTRLRDWLRALRRDGDAFRTDGLTRPVRLGDLRLVLHRTFLEHGLAEDQGDSIVSQGRDAGVPHNRGDDDEPLRAGTSVIVDIFPGEVGGGYHSDMTRTFCMGPAPAALREIHAQTAAAYAAGLAAVVPGRPCRSAQDAACEMYERHGHATRRTNEATQEGYVHNLGHGVGLSVHDPPLLGGPPTNTVALEPGMIVTVEPGLYYPERGMGCRIEDLFHVRPDGTVENLTPFPHDLEIGIRG
jgi:Xaa-Pro aminopeptidase